MSEVDLSISSLSSKILPEINRKRVLKLLYQEKTLTRREISDILVISLPTVSKLVDSLLEEGFVTEGGRQQSTGGRKPRLIAFAPTSRYAVGVDIRPQGLRFVASDLWGYICLSQVCDIVFEDTPAYWEAFVQHTENFIDMTTFGRDILIGVGITLSGTIAKEKPLVEYSSTLGIKNVDLSFLQSRLPYPLMFLNDAYAAGYTEFWNSSRLNLMFYLSISEGISGAIMIQNELFTGFNNRAGSVGHITIQPTGGKACTCGKTGCFEAYCGVKALTEPFAEALPVFFSQLAAGEPRHKAVWDEYLSHLAIGISNIRQCLDIAIIIGGQLGPYIGDYLPELFAHICAISSFPEKNRLYINAARFGKDASALGVALQLINKFLDF